MLAAGAHQCPICTLTGYQCDHELVCYSPEGLAESRLGGRIEALAHVAAQVLARALCLRLRPKTAELQALYADSASVDLDSADQDCLSWVLEVTEALPGVRSSEGEYFAVLWSADAYEVQNRLDDLRLTLEVEMCCHPGDLRVVRT